MSLTFTHCAVVLWTLQANHCIRHVNVRNGTVAVTTLAGAAGVHGYADGTGKEARFNAPDAMCVDFDNGRILVCDRLNHCIRAVSETGVVTTVAGCREKGFADGGPFQAKFNCPSGIAMDHKRRIVVSDTGTNAIAHDRSVTCALPRSPLTAPHLPLCYDLRG
jgi:hypothetical protein